MAAKFSTQSGKVRTTNLAPGDLFQFAFVDDNARTAKGEEGWSWNTNSWTYVGDDVLHTVVAIDGYVLTWMNANGLFTAELPVATMSVPSNGRAQVYARPLL